MIQICVILLATFSGFDKKAQEELKAVNEHTETIYRLEGEHYAPPIAFVRQGRELYPWEAQWIGRLPRITKEHFRCRGSAYHPPLKIQDTKDIPLLLMDCSGIDSHSLPMQQGREVIYPLLISLLNEIQEVTQARVVVTCGHRCPQHNRYAQGSTSSKHLIGAEVDFYVEGKEYAPQDIVALFITRYQNTEPLRLLQENQWGNREIKLTLVPKTEGRNVDNQHPYPYLTLELLFDKETGKAVHFSWSQAHTGYVQW